MSLASSPRTRGVRLVCSLYCLCLALASVATSGPDRGRPPSPRFEPGYDDGIKPLFENNRRWVKKRTSRDSQYFKKLEAGQQPKFLFIGCSDSRVPVEGILGLKCGEVFVHRNVANLVVNTDLNLLAVLQYAVEVLKVKDIIICGHYGCGGVKAALGNQEHGIVDFWLREIRDVHRLHAPELRGISCEKQRHRRLIELNVKEQCMNLAANTIIQKSVKETGFPRIHGVVYDIANGYLTKLDIDIKKEAKSHRDVYMIHDNHLFQVDEEDEEEEVASSDDEAKEEVAPPATVVGNNGAIQAPTGKEMEAEVQAQVQEAPPAAASIFSTSTRTTERPWRRKASYLWLAPEFD